MTLWEILAVALALAVDAFTVGAAVGLTHREPRQIFRLSFHFGLFQALLPLVGALFGTTLGSWIDPWRDWLAFGLLAVIGARMIIEALREDRGKRAQDPTRGLCLVGLSFSVSIDALAVGFSLGLRDVNIPLAVAVIGVVAAVLTFVGMLLGGGIASRFGRRAGVVGGLVLIGLGARIGLERFNLW